MQRNGHEEISLSYGSLQVQFGTGIAEENYRQFRKELKLAFGKVSEQWRSADGEKLPLYYEFSETRLTLYRSPMLVATKHKASPPPPSQLAGTRPNIKERRIDQETYRRARQLAGQWDVDSLIKKYFAWIEGEGISPKSLRAHFLAFVKTHCSQNPGPS